MFCHQVNKTTGGHIEIVYFSLSNIGCLSVYFDQFTTRPIGRSKIPEKMKGMSFLLTLCTVVSFAVALPLKAQTTKPNVVIIYMDDMGYGDIEPFGMTGLKTPNFNKLASEGVRFTNYNTAQAVCTASRAALLTGCYPNRIGLYGALLPGAKVALNHDEQTLAELLRDNGYATAMLGKWHLGNEAPYWPMTHGFQSYYGLPYSHDMWPMDYDGKPITDKTSIRSPWPHLPVIENDKQISTIQTLEQQSTWTTGLTDRGVKYINTHKNDPFFLYLAHPLPHVPLAVSDKFKGKSKLGLFGDVIMELDWSLGMIMKALDDAGIARNTILIVTSDNGPWLHFGNHAGSAGGFREGKGTPFEGGTRVPFIARWPGKIAPGSVNGSLITSMDILPTICAITTSKMPLKKIDGIDCSAMFLSPGAEGPRKAFYYYYGNNNLMAIRYEQWKLILPHQSASYEAGDIGKDGHPGKIVSGHDVGRALHDLSHDPGEEYDVQKLYPDIVSQLEQLAEEARKELGDAITSRQGSGTREPARLK
jgi:arylsulfatase